MALSVNRVISVQLSISPKAAPGRGFGTLLIIGDSDVISGAERVRTYTNINDVAKDFGINAPEYEAARLYFAQDPAPEQVMIGKWNKQDTEAVLQGAILSDEQQQIAEWNTIKNGTFAYRLNNIVKSIEDLDFSGQTNLSGIAEVINRKLEDVRLDWDGERFSLKSLSTGSNQQLGYLEPVAPQTNVAKMLGLSAGLASKVSGTDRIPGTPEQPATSGKLVGTDINSQLETLKQVTDGSFKLSVDSEQLSLTELDFSSGSSFDDIAGIITEHLDDKATCTYSGGSMVITSASTGAASIVSDAIAGEVTTPAQDATSGVLTGTNISEQLATLKAIKDGSFKISVDSSELSIEGLDFSSANSLDDIATKVTEKLQSKATAAYKTDHLVITSVTSGASSQVSVATAGNITHSGSEATAGFFTGAQISDESGSLVALKAISGGTIKYNIDGTGETETAAINLTEATDLSNVATLITAQLSSKGTCTYSAQKFVITSASTGASSSVAITQGTDAGLFTALNFASGSATPGKAAVIATDNQLHTKLGLAEGTPQNGHDAVKANDNQLHTKLGLAGGQSTPGTDLKPEVPEVPATAGKLTGGRHDSLDKIKAVYDGNFVIAVDNGASQTLGELDFSKVQSLSDVAVVISTQLKNASCIAKGDALVITSVSTGSSSAVDYASDAPLDEKDISAKLGLTKDTALPPVAGFDNESPLEALAILTDKTANWYGATFAAADMPNDEQLLACAEYIEAQTDTTRIFGMTVQDSRVLDSSYRDDLASRCADKQLNRSVIQYSSSEPFAICSFLGRAFSVNFNGNMTTITMMYKQEPTVEPEDLTESQALALSDKRCNVFVKYNNDTAIIQNGVMCGNYWFDERHGADWLQNYVQNNVWNFVYTSKTKIGQDDSGITNIIGVINNSLNQAYSNGYIGAGVWNGDSFGQLKNGDFMPTGYYVYAPPMSTQTQAERDARVSVPIQVGAKLLGAIHSIDISITLNR